MQVEDLLSAAFAGIDKGFETVGQSRSFGDFGNFQHHFSQKADVRARRVPTNQNGLWESAADEAERRG